MKKLKQWFIGDYLAKTTDVFERSKIELLYSYSISFWILGTAFYISAIVRGYTYHAFVLTFAVIALLLIPFILKYKQNVRIASIWYIIQQILVSIGETTIQQNKPDITSGLWIMTFVLFSFFLFGRKWGLIIFLMMNIISGVSIFDKRYSNTCFPAIPRFPIEILTPLLLNLIVVWMFIKTRSDAEEHIKQQSLQLEEKSRELETKNHDVRDSINYAKRIQYAVLPNEEAIQRVIPLSFIYYLPKDIVSGDFYWFYEINKEEYIIICGDCTGHGVPGAFMTVIGSNLLNQIVIDNKVYEPGKILMNLDELLNSTLKQDKHRLQGVQDGMDLSLIKVNKLKKECIITSAKRPVILVRDKQMKEFKGSKHSLGGMRSGEKHFEEIKFQLKEDDVLFTYTDGYTYQFGGEKGKKYSSKRLKEFLVSISEDTALVQKQKLEQEFTKWRGQHEQVDDVNVLGIRF
ncbi:MAG: SpoIIE family protein phosphatase [Sphingobacteriaceae bacterium]|nr:SpoIIE family protein phosphatase [Sphingobacteriaceae bacterium]